MKTKFTLFALFATMFATQIQAQDMTTVRANNSDISDNLDLKAVASVFGDSEDLADFERRLNDPKLQISNLDLNGDNQVDYLRVIETVENNTHLIIIQSVLEKDVFQDVATVEVEKDRNNNVQVQVVGDVYMYGSNYIYEPVYVHTPVIYNAFWVNSYSPYYSPYYYSYYPSYYYGWSPYPVYRYHRNVNVHINVNNHYNYVNTRRSSKAQSMYNGRRSDGYARQYPNKSFAQRNNNATNRHDLVQNRSQNSRSQISGTRNATTRNNTNTSRNNAGATRNTSGTTPTRTNSNTSRTNDVKASNLNATTRNTTPSNTSTTRTQSSTPVRNTATQRVDAPSRVQSQAPVRTQTPVQTPVRTQAPVQTPVRTQSQAPVRTQSAPTNVSRDNSGSQRSAAPQQTQRASGGNAGGRSRG